MKFNYEDLFIFRTGYNFYYTSPDAAIIKDYFDISHSVRAGVESSGNLLHLISKTASMKQDSLGQYRLFGLAYAQYIKSDFVWTMSMNIDRYKSLLFHLETGVAYPYGNARMLPFEKRYYAGGANGVRGWTVRGLGPGSYVSRNGTIDYINQSGDIKLDFSMEYRMHLFWKFNGAFFVDAGNIWTIYDYDDQPNGMFHWDTFYKQIAVSYGAGIRVDLNFLILRFDAAMKAINPAYMEGPLRYPISHPKLSRDFAWHFAVGYPF
jgi:outer membrane protein assembly factor BamA